LLIIIGIVLYLVIKFKMTSYFIISKGKHCCRPITMNFHINKVRDSKDIIFYDNCWYDESQQTFTGVNKLFGFTYGGVHSNSIRFGWRPSKDRGKIVLYDYCYNKGNRLVYTAIATIKTNKQYTLGLFYSKTTEEVFFILDGRIISTVDFDKPRFLIGYTSSFYFGGKETAPHEMQIKKY